jgi:hypothetical protein
MDRDRFDIPLNIRILWTETRLVALETGSHLSDRHHVRGRGALPLVAATRPPIIRNQPLAIASSKLGSPGCFANTASQLARSTGVAFKEGRRFKGSL